MNHDTSWGMTQVKIRRLGRGVVALGVAVGVMQWAVSSASADALPTPGMGGTSIPGRCTQYEPVLAKLAPPGGWDVTLMSTFMWRESKCDPTVRSATFDTGLLQINDVNHVHLRAVLGEWVGRWSLTDPTQNIRAAAALCSYWQGRGQSCYWPWKIVTTQPPSAVAAAPTATTPPTPAPVPGRCTQYEAALAANAPSAGWDIQKMSRLMWSTSRCNPSARWATSTGLLRISTINSAYLARVLGQPVNRAALTDATTNIRSAAALCTQSRRGGKSCYAPWGLSG
jgi:hypothetical protein